MEEDSRDEFTVTVASADPIMGSATVDGNPSAFVLDGDVATLVATANEGYHFVRWNDNNTDNPRTITVTADVVYTAYFAEGGGTEGIDEMEMANARIFSIDGRLVVDGAEGNTVWLYDLTGRMLASKQDDFKPLEFNVPASGVYLIKIGPYPARKIVVTK